MASSLSSRSSHLHRRDAVAMLLAAVAVIAVALAVLEVRGSGRSPAGRSSSSSAAAGPGRIVLSVATGRPLRPVPRSFLGVSTEYWTPPIWTDQTTLL